MLKFFPERSRKPVRNARKKRGRIPKWLTVVAIASGVVGLRAELTHWAENIEAAGKLEAVFFRTVALPGGSVAVRRPPKETRP